MRMLYNVPLSKQIEKRENKATLSEYELILHKIKQNKLKRVDRRLQVIKLHLEGKDKQEIADKTDFTLRWVNGLIKSYKEQGLGEFARHKYGGNNRAMSVADEEELLAKFKDDSEKGKLVVANTIKKAFDEKRGKVTGRGYIYMLLKRHEARKVMPRSAHPKKASEAEIEASKKLT
jgi:transposase